MLQLFPVSHNYGPTEDDADEANNFSCCEFTGKVIDSFYGKFGKYAKFKKI